MSVPGDTVAWVGNELARYMKDDDDVPKLSVMMKTMIVLQPKSFLLLSS